MNINMYIPVLVVVLSNTIYHISSKSTPSGINTFASLSITYVVGAVASLVLYFVTQRNGNIIAEYKMLNWSSFALGIAIIGLEAGFMWMYKVGWEVSQAQVVQSAFVAIFLVIVGAMFFKEAITVQKIIGIVICLAGLYLLNK